MDSMEQSSGEAGNPNNDGMVVRNGTGQGGGRRALQYMHLHHGRAMLPPGYRVGFKFTLYSWGSAVLSFSISYWPLNNQYIENERRRWSDFCEPIARSGKAFGYIYITFGVLLVFMYIAAISQTDKTRRPLCTMLMLCLVTLSYVALFCLSVASLIITETETAQLCHLESQEFLTESKRFFGFGMVVSCLLGFSMYQLFKQVQRMTKEVKLYGAQRDDENEPLTSVVVSPHDDDDAPKE
jgi:hypothetical protein